MAGADTLPELRRFVRSALPSMVRRLACWNGLDPRQRDDVVDDLEQELVLDYLEHRTAIDALPARERHARWFRVLGQRHYQLRLRSRRLTEAQTTVGALADRATLCRETPARAGCELRAALEDAALEPRDRALVLQLLAASDHLKNGRINAEATARRIGISVREVRALWTRLADRLGYGEEFVDFWRRRLVEALIGLAADLLRDAGVVHLLDERRRPRPDPAAHLRRIRRIKNELSLRPLAPDLKRVLAHFTARGIRDRLDARTTLACAASLAPDEPDLWPWTFEAALAAGDLGGAAGALRAWHRAPADPVAARLARARWIEARGGPAARRRAGRVLRRGQRRHRDLRLAFALRRHDEAGGAAVSCSHPLRATPRAAPPADRARAVDDRGPGPTTDHRTS